MGMCVVSGLLSEHIISLTQTKTNNLLQCGCAANARQDMLLRKAAVK